MPVKVVVKGDTSGDYELFADIAHKNRVFDEEVLDMVDPENRLLYSIPLPKIRYIQILDQAVDMPKYAGDNRSILVTVEGNVTDIAFQCDRVVPERIINKLTLDLYIYMGLDEKTKNDKWFKELSIPFENIKHINYNYIPQESDEGQEFEQQSKTKTSYRKKLQQ